MSERNSGEKNKKGAYWKKKAQNKPRHSPMLGRYNGPSYIPTRQEEWMRDLRNIGKNTGAYIHVNLTR